MNRIHKCGLVFLILGLMLSLSGCIKTVDQLYCLPRRSEGYHDLQAVMDQQMESLEFCAPSNGENQQAVQTADLDGDGQEEVILFARGSDDTPLKIIVFDLENGSYRVAASLERTGTSFDQVEYIDMDGRPGLEIVVGTRLGSQFRRLTVFSMADGAAEELMWAHYRKFLCVDLNEDGRDDLMVLSAGKDSGQLGLAQIYFIPDAEVERSAEVSLSEPVGQMKRVTTGNLSGGQKAVFVASAVNSNTIVTDVLTVVDGALTNLSCSCDADAAVQTMRDFYVYAEDIDGDGEIELPELISAPLPEHIQLKAGREHLIRWYSLTPRGETVTKRYTYHNYQQGWYLELAGASAERVCVVQETPGIYSFWLWDAEGIKATKLWTVFQKTDDTVCKKTLGGSCFSLLETASATYLCRLEPQAIQLGATEEMLCRAFHLIQRGWKTGEM